MSINRRDIDFITYFEMHLKMYWIISSSIWHFFLVWISHFFREIDNLVHRITKRPTKRLSTNYSFCFLPKYQVQIIWTFIISLGFDRRALKDE